MPEFKPGDLVALKSDTETPFVISTRKAASPQNLCEWLDGDAKPQSQWYADLVLQPYQSE